MIDISLTQPGVLLVEYERRVKEAADKKFITHKQRKSLRAARLEIVLEFQRLMSDNNMLAKEGRRLQEMVDVLMVENIKITDIVLKERDRFRKRLARYETTHDPDDTALADGLWGPGSGGTPR